MELIVLGTQDIIQKFSPSSNILSVIVIFIVGDLIFFVSKYKLAFH